MHKRKMPGAQRPPESQRSLPNVKSGSSTTADRPNFITEDEPKRPAPRERGKGEKVDPVFKKLKKLFNE